MNALPFSYSPRVRRPPLRLPEGARLAVYVTPNVEHFPVGAPALSLFAGTLGCPPDPLNYGWRDYGMRAGLWRMADALETRGITPSVALNAAVCEHFPQVIEEGVARGWTWICHGRDNATFQAGIDEDEERAFLTACIETIEQATGTRPRGWLGPALTETAATPRLLSELGLSYVLDWGNDDEPFLLDRAGGPSPVVALPYLGAELSDIVVLHLRGGSPDDYARQLIEHIGRLHAEGAERPAAVGIGVHPFLLGRPSAIGPIERVLDHVVALDGVWTTTADELAAWSLSTLEEDRRARP